MHIADACRVYYYLNDETTVDNSILFVLDTVSQEPTELGNTGPWLPDNQSRDLNNESGLVVYLHIPQVQIKTTCDSGYILPKLSNGNPSSYVATCSVHDDIFFKNCTGNNTWRCEDSSATL